MSNQVITTNLEFANLTTIQSFSLSSALKILFSATSFEKHLQSLASKCRSHKCPISLISSLWAKAAKKEPLDILPLRIKISEIYIDRFNETEECDPIDYLQVILNAFHFRVCGLDCSRYDEEWITRDCNGACCMHQSFFFGVDEIHKCVCGSSMINKWDPNNICQYFNVAGLFDNIDIEKSNMLVKYPNFRLKTEKNLGNFIECDNKIITDLTDRLKAADSNDCESNCSSPTVKIDFHLNKSPESYLINLIWNSHRTTHLQSFLTTFSISPFINLSDLYIHNGPLIYNLSAIVFFGRNRYEFAELKNKVWIFKGLHKFAGFYELLKEITVMNMHPVAIMYLRAQGNNRVEWEVDEYKYLKLEKLAAECDFLKDMTGSEVVEEQMEISGLCQNDKTQKKRVSVKKDMVSIDEAVRPARNSIIVEEYKKEPEVNKGKWQCECKVMNDDAWDVCNKCGKIKPGLDGWVCTICTFRNSENDSKDICKSCWQWRKGSVQGEIRNGSQTKLGDQEFVTPGEEDSFKIDSRKKDDNKKRIEEARLRVKYIEEQKKRETEAEEQRMKEEKWKQENKREEEKRNREERQKKIKDDYLREEEDKRKKEEAKRIKDEREKKIRDEYFQEETKRISQEEIKRTEAKYPASELKNIKKSSENQKVVVEVEEDLTWTCVCRAANSCEWEICMKCESLKPGLSGWVCTICKTRNEDYAYRCKSCLTEQGKKLSKINEYWTCPKCKSAISKLSKICYDCGVYNDELGEMEIKQPTQASKYQDWECLNCGTKNYWASSRCIRCPSLKEKPSGYSTVDGKKPAKASAIEQKSSNYAKPEPNSPQEKPSPSSNPSQRPYFTNVPKEALSQLVDKQKSIDFKPQVNQRDNPKIPNEVSRQSRAAYVTSEPVASKYSQIERALVGTGSSEVEIKRQTENSSSSEWKCNCGSTNESFRKLCKGCYKGRSSILDWDCASCSTKNSDTLLICKYCGSRKNEPAKYVEKAACKGCGFLRNVGERCECEKKSIEVPKKVSEQVQSLEWKCYFCDYPNSKTSDVCYGCFKPKLSNDKKFY